MDVSSCSANIYFVVVIYNKECSESPSISFAVKKQQELNIIVVDNSTIESNNRLFCEENSITYIPMNGNAGLSKAYNAALDCIGRKDGFVIWADDDTEFPDNYVNEMIEFININKYTIALPLVLAGKEIYSPITIDCDGVPKRIKNLDELGKSITGINSGMMVSLDFYENYRYDENMFLDFIDHDVCVSCQQNGGTVGFVKCVVLMQNSFFSSRIHLRSMANRRKIYRHDFRFFCKKHDISRIIAEKKLIHGEIAIGMAFIKQMVGR